MEGFIMLMNNAVTSIVAAVAKANCYTVGYTGVKSTIEVSLEKGPDLLRPRAPAIYVGRRFIPNDFNRPAVVSMNENKTSFVSRAALKFVPLPNNRFLTTLSQPSGDKLEEVLVLVNVGMPLSHRLKPVEGQDGKSYVLDIQRGLHHTGQVISAENDIALVLLKEGDQLNVLFRDGIVRGLKMMEGELRDNSLTHHQMVKIRIADAQKRINNALPSEGVKHVLSGMVDLFHRLAGDKAEAARSELRKFFLDEISEEYLSLIHRKLTAVLYVIDPVMVRALAAQTKVQAVSPLVGAIDMAASILKRAKAEQKLSARRLVDRARTDLTKGVTGGGGQVKNKK